MYWSKEIMSDMGRREKEWRARAEAKTRVEILQADQSETGTRGVLGGHGRQEESGAMQTIERGRRRRIEVAERVFAECKGGVEDVKYTWCSSVQHTVNYRE